MAVNGAATAYVVDPFSPVDAVPQVLLETSAGQSTRYLYGLDLFAQTQGTTLTYLAYDALSVRLHLDEGGAIVESYRYGPFGEEMGEGPAGYGSTGERWDAPVGLLYLRARYYAPEVGRFVSRHASSGETPWPLTLHRFVYVLNRPTRYVDPRGLQCSFDISTGEVSCFGELTGMGVTVTMPNVEETPGQMPGQYAYERGYHYVRERHGELAARFPSSPPPLWAGFSGLFGSSYVEPVVPIPATFARPTAVCFVGPSPSIEYKVRFSVDLLEYQEGTEVWIEEHYDFSGELLKLAQFQKRYISVASLKYSLLASFR